MHKQDKCSLAKQTLTLVYQCSSRGNAPIFLDKTHSPWAFTHTHMIQPIIVLWDIAIYSHIATAKHLLLASVLVLLGKRRFTPSNLPPAVVLCLIIKLNSYTKVDYSPKAKALAVRTVLRCLYCTCAHAMCAHLGTHAMHNLASPPP